MVRPAFQDVIDNFIPPCYPAPPSVRMRQQEPQTMAVIEVLPVLVEQNKHKKSESERKRGNKVLRPHRDGGTTWHKRLRQDDQSNLN